MAKSRRSAPSGRKVAHGLVSVKIPDRQPESCATGLSVLDEELSEESRPFLPLHPHHTQACGRVDYTGVRTYAVAILGLQISFESRLRSPNRARRIQTHEGYQYYGRSSTPSQSISSAGEILRSHHHCQKSSYGYRIFIRTEFMGVDQAAARVTGTEPSMGSVMEALSATLD